MKKPTPRQIETAAIVTSAVVGVAAIALIVSYERTRTVSYINFLRTSIRASDTALAQTLDHFGVITPK